MDKLKLKALLPIGTAVLSVVGLVETALEAMKAREKELEMRKELPEDATRKDILKLYAKCYKKAVVLGLGTVASIIGGAVFSTKQQFNLIAAGRVLSTAYHVKDATIEEVCGPEKAAEVFKAEKENAEEPQYVCAVDGITGLRVECAKADLYYAEKELNRLYCVNGEASHADFLRAVGFSEKDIPKDAELRTWESDYMIDMYDAYWLDINFSFYTTEDGMHYCTITYPCAPRTPQEREDEERWLNAVFKDKTIDARNPQFV